MKKNKRGLVGFLSGVLVAVLIIGLAAPAAASSLYELLEVYTGVRVYVNDIAINAGDLNGNPEAFIYNGTTYVPIRAVSNSLHENVLWDGDTKSVYIGKHVGTATGLLAVCPPYETRRYSAPDVLTIMGTGYKNGFSLENYAYRSESDTYAYFNMNGKYNTLSFDVGHVDGSPMAGGICKIYVDGELTETIELHSYMMLEHYQIPLHGALQVRIVLAEYEDNRYSGTQYGFVNAELS